MDVSGVALAMQALALLSPTRPHPEAPNQPPLNLLVGPVAAAFDYLKDVGSSSGWALIAVHWLKCFIAYNRPFRERFRTGAS